MDRKILAGSAGVVTGIAGPIIFEKFAPSIWGDNQIIPNVTGAWNKGKILLPIGIGTGLASAGVFAYQRNETLGSFLAMAGFAMLAKGIFDLIVTFITPSASARLSSQRQRPIFSPVTVVPKPLLPPGAEQNQKFHKNGSVDTSRTWIDKKVIVS